MSLRRVPRRDVFWLALALLICAALVLGQQDVLTRSLGRLESADWRLSTGALFVLAAVELAKARRWQVLYGDEMPSFRVVLQATVLGQAANALMPVRVGELARLLWAGPTRDGLGRGVAGLLITKALDAAILTLLVACVLGAWVLTRIDLFLGGVLLACVAVALVVAFWRISILDQRVAALTLWLGGYARELRSGTFFLVAVTSTAAWMLGAAANVLVLEALNVAPTADLVVRILGAGYVGGLLPAPPGRVGVFEGAVAGALVSGGMAADAALAAALLLHGLQLIKVALLAIMATRWPISEPGPSVEVRPATEDVMDR